MWTWLIFCVFSIGDTLKIWGYRWGPESGFYEMHSVCRAVNLNSYIFTEENYFPVRQVITLPFKDTILIMSSNGEIYRSKLSSIYFSKMNVRNLETVTFKNASLSNQIHLLGGSKRGFYYSNLGSDNWKIINPNDPNKWRRDLEISDIAVSKQLIAGGNYLVYVLLPKGVSYCIGNPNLGPIKTTWKPLLNPYVDDLFDTLDIGQLDPAWNAIIDTFIYFGDTLKGIIFNQGQTDSISRIISNFIISHADFYIFLAKENGEFPSFTVSLQKNETEYINIDFDNNILNVNGHIVPFRFKIERDYRILHFKIGKEFIKFEEKFTSDSLPFSGFDTINVIKIRTRNTTGKFLIDAIILKPYFYSIDVLQGTNPILVIGTSQGIILWDSLSKFWETYLDTISFIDVQTTPFDTLECFALSSKGKLYRWVRQSGFSPVVTPLQKIKGFNYSKFEENTISIWDTIVYVSYDKGLTWNTYTAGLSTAGYLKWIKNIHDFSVTGLDSLYAATDEGVINYLPSYGEWRNISYGVIDIIPTDVISFYSKALEDSTPVNAVQGTIEILDSLFGPLNSNLDNDPRVFVFLGNTGYILHADSRTLYPYVVKSEFLDPTSEYFNAREMIIVDPIDRKYETFWDTENIYKNLSRAYTNLIMRTYDLNEKDFLIYGFEEMGRYFVCIGDRNSDSVEVDRFNSITFVQRNRPFERELKYSLMMYIYEKFGINVLRAILQDTLNGINSIETNTGITFDSLSTLLSLALFFDSPSGPYSFINLKARLLTSNIYLSFLPSLLGTYPASVTLVDIPDTLFTTIYFDGADAAGFKVIKIEADSSAFDSIGLNSENVASITDTLPYYILVIRNDTINSTQYFSLHTDYVPTYTVKLNVLNPYRPSYSFIYWKNPLIIGAQKSGYSFVTYRVYRGKDTLNMIQIADVGQDTFFIDYTVNPESTYYYAVSIVWSVGEGPKSNYVFTHPTYYPPPYNLSAINQREGVFLFWNPPDTLQPYTEINKNKKQLSYLTGYKVYHSLYNSYDSLQLIQDTWIDNYFIHTTPDSGTYNYYSISAIYNDTIESIKTPLVEIFVDTPPPGNVNQLIVIDNGILANYLSNYGTFGGEFGAWLPGMTWPSYLRTRKNDHLWGSYFAVGAEVNGVRYVTATSYPPTVREWQPDEACKVSITENAIWVESGMNDFKDNYRNSDYRHLGLKIKFRQLYPRVEYDQNWIGLEVYITFHPEESDIPGIKGYLQNVFVSLWMDYDVSAFDFSDPHIDDLVDYEGYDRKDSYTDTVDLITLLPDGTYLNVPDGVPDEFLVFGDEPDEKTLNGDTFYISRNLGYMYDGDNPNSIENDAEEPGCKGYVGEMLIYSPPTISDSVWVQGNDTLRMCLPFSHQYWTWVYDPATDDEIYEYMLGIHPFSQGYKFLPNPLSLGLYPFDYRSFLTVGPFDLKGNDTLKLVFAFVIGIGLNGGYDTLLFGNKWIPGIRHAADRVFKAYYRGSTHSDPLHPSGPDEDIHWGEYLGIKEIVQKKFTRKIIIPVYTYGSHNIHLILPQKERGKIVLYDAAGRKKWEYGPKYFRRGINLIKLPPLPSGTYFILYKSKGGKLKNKFFILK